MLYDVRIEVEEVRGSCAAGYRKGDFFTLRGFYIEAKEGTRICLHALVAMASLLSPFSHGVPADQLGIGEGGVGRVQCPDPGPPVTCGGTVVFKMVRSSRD